MNILSVISELSQSLWVSLSCLPLSLLTFISPVYSSWRHIWALIFAQSHVGWTQRVPVRRVGEEGERAGERESTADRRKGGQTSPKWESDRSKVPPWPLPPLTHGNSARKSTIKQQGNKKTEAKITKGKRLLSFPHFVLGFSTFSTKKLMPTSSVSVGPQSVGMLWCVHCSLLWSPVRVPLTKGIK